MAVGYCLILPAALRKSRWTADLPMAHFSHDFHAHFGQFPRQYQQSHGRQAARNDGEIGVFPA